MTRVCHLLAILLVLSSAGAAIAAELPFAQGDYVLRDFRFSTGETLPELRLHYTTLGTPQRDAAGVVRNAVLVLHGTNGSGANFTGDAFAGTLFGPGQPLDAARYFLILPDNLGHGRSSAKAVRNAVAVAYRFAAEHFITRVQQDIAAAAGNHP